jgi:hypothetical protein
MGKYFCDLNLHNRAFVFNIPFAHAKFNNFFMVFDFCGGGTPWPSRRRSTKLFVAELPGICYIIRVGTMRLRRMGHRAGIYQGERTVMSMSVPASISAYVEGLAARAGTYIPHRAGMGASYLSGSFSADPANFASPDFAGIRSPAPRRDEYIPSFDMSEIEYEEARAERYAPSPSVTAEETDGARQADEDAGNPGAVGTGEAEEDGADEEQEGGVEGTADRADETYTPQEQRIIDNLAARDREVRAHEQAHISAGGAYVRGGATYEYENGPDGRRYAVGGEVSIDASPVRDNPEATIAKMQVVRAAALAPAEPSGQDRTVAASAARAEGQARVELAERRAAAAAYRNNDPHAQPEPAQQINFAA